MARATSAVGGYLRGPIAKNIGHFQSKIIIFSEALLHYLCISIRKFKTKSAFLAFLSIAIRSTTVGIRQERATLLQIP